MAIDFKRESEIFHTIIDTMLDTFQMPYSGGNVIKMIKSVVISFRGKVLMRSSQQTGFIMIKVI